MTYPGTERRERTSIESSLIADVLRLEKERDELVDALRPLAALSQPHQSKLHPHIPLFAINGKEITKRDVDLAAVLLARYPK